MRKRADREEGRGFWEVGLDVLCLKSGTEVGTVLGANLVS